ncbi:MAG: M48 family metallopeptidase [Acidiferrobacterales bacterium]
MRELKASFYDGKTSQKTDVTIHLSRTGELWIRRPSGDLTYALSAVRITPRVGNTPRSIYLPDGAKCETLDNDAIDAFLKQRGAHAWQSLLHKLESRLLYVALAVVITIASVWGLIQYGVPALAKHAAYSLPPSVDQKLGAEGLDAMDRIWFSPSELSEARQHELRSVFQSITDNLDDGHHYRLEFRKSSRLGANAFALPSGIVVMTDALAQLAESNNELIAVLAHEVGHVVNRHALRRLLQDSATVLLVATITGDIASITALSAALPTILIEAKYSRDFEREADQYALAYLHSQDINRSHFANILLRLQKNRPENSGVFDYLSSHPATKERIKALEHAG